MENVLPNQTFK